MKKIVKKETVKVSEEIIIRKKTSSINKRFSSVNKINKKSKS